MARKQWSSFTHAAIGCLVAVLVGAGGWGIHRRWFFPTSDVKIITAIGFWPYQEDVAPQAFDVELVEARFGLFNTGEALLHMRIAGQVQSESNGWRPRIAAVQITERAGGIGDDKYVDIEVVPVVDVRRDRALVAGTLPFTTDLEYVVHSYQWGLNRYVVHCSDLSREVTIGNYK